MNSLSGWRVGSFVIINLRVWIFLLTGMCTYQNTWCFFTVRCSNFPLLYDSWRNDTNVILADEMGLGKTVQSVSMLGFLQVWYNFSFFLTIFLSLRFFCFEDNYIFLLFQNAQQIHGPFLVVVPLSTLSNWAKEFRKWLPDMNIIVYVGNRAGREVRETSGIPGPTCLN